MAAGVTSRVWSVAELIGLLDRPIEGADSN
jgi:hypothetical protein